MQVKNQPFLYWIAQSYTSNYVRFYYALQLGYFWLEREETEALSHIVICILVFVIIWCRKLSLAIMKHQNWTFFRNFLPVLKKSNPVYYLFPSICLQWTYLGVWRLRIVLAACRWRSPGWWSTCQWWIPWPQGWNTSRLCCMLSCAFTGECFK